jgi:hypothetical protein
MVTIGPRRQFGVIGHIAVTVYPLYSPTIGSTPHAPVDKRRRERAGKGMNAAQTAQAQRPVKRIAINGS